MSAVMEEKLDIREKGGVRNGERQTSEIRLFMQLLAFGGCAEPAGLERALERSGVEGALYEDANDPTGIAVVALGEDPGALMTRLRALAREREFAALNPKPDYTWLGRTYAIGHEPDLEDWLLRKPRRTVLNRDWPWAVWYPLKRTGAFAALPPEEQGAMLREHGKIGRAFGEADLAHDVRLACFGLDKNDNDFVIGLIARELHPLSACVQAMRKTRQTSGFIERMGPFFVGRAVWRSKPR